MSNITSPTFLLFNKLSAHKQIIYDAFAAALGEVASIDFYIYNNDLAFFKKLLLNKKDDYTYFAATSPNGDVAFSSIKS